MITSSRRTRKVTPSFETLESLISPGGGFHINVDISQANWSNTYQKAYGSFNTVAQASSTQQVNSVSLLSDVEISQEADVSASASN